MTLPLPSSAPQAHLALAHSGVGGHLWVQRIPRRLLPAQLFTLTLLSPVLSEQEAFPAEAASFLGGVCSPRSQRCLQRPSLGAPLCPPSRPPALAHLRAVPASTCVWPGLPCLLMCEDDD